jgi:hypothetical protein
MVAMALANLDAAGLYITRDKTVPRFVDAMRGLAENLQLEICQAVRVSDTRELLADHTYHMRTVCVVVN